MNSKFLKAFPLILYFGTSLIVVGSESSDFPPPKAFSPGIKTESIRNPIPNDILLLKTQIDKMDSDVKAYEKAKAQVVVRNCAQKKMGLVASAAALSKPDTTNLESLKKQLDDKIQALSAASNSKKPDFTFKP